MLVSSIDIGSNSVILFIGDKTDKGLFSLVDDARVTCLGKDVRTNGVFSDESMNETYNVLREFSVILKSFEIDPRKIIITATEASRLARNANVFYRRIFNDFGLKVRIISPAGEAFYTALGVSIFGNISLQNNLLFDIGGASTEIIRFDINKKEITNFISLPIGAVLASELNDIQLEQYINDIVSKITLDDFVSESVICVAGTMTAIVAMILKQKVFVPQEINQFEMSVNDLKVFIKTLSNQSPKDLQLKFPFLGKRSQNVVSGGFVVANILDAIGVKTIYTSTFGLRHGIAFTNEIDPKFIV